MYEQIVDAVHAQGSFIYCQLWALGRAAYPGHPLSVEYISASATPIEARSSEVPRALTIDEMKVYLENYGKAAATAVERCGFDGVEIHLGNGYLLDQFLQDTCNSRTDEYGGSVENRCKFPLEAVDAIVKAVGAKKSAIRISPWTTSQGLSITHLGLYLH